MGVEIIELCDGDCEEVAALCQQRGLGGEFTDPERLRSFRRRNSRLSLIARESGRLVAALLCGNTPGRGQVQHIVLAPDAEGRRIEQDLANRAMLKLQCKRVHKFKLDTHDAEAGKRFWRSVVWSDTSIDDGEVGVDELPDSVPLPPEVASAIESEAAAGPEPDASDQPIGEEPDAPGAAAQEEAA